MKSSFFDIEIENLSKQDILEKIRKYTNQSADFVHIVSLNPETIVTAEKNRQFKKVLQTAQIKIIDGIGVLLAGRMLGLVLREKIAGVDLMEDLLCLANESRLRVAFIGGDDQIADKVVECQKRLFPEVSFLSCQGILNIRHPQPEEVASLLAIVTDFKPHLVFVAFGSPDQELWLDRHKDRFSGMVCMGVGGGFDYLSGNLPRAPRFLRRLGFEWLFRLIMQPSRFKRQLKLLIFIALVIKELFRPG